MMRSIRSIAVFLACMLPAQFATAGSVTTTIVQNGSTVATKSFGVADADIDRITAAFQQIGNNAVNGTATKQQVLETLIGSNTGQIAAAVQQFELSRSISQLPPPAAVPLTPQ